MTDERTPSRPPDSDALLDRYRESARLDDTTRPAPNVRAAILEQAAAQARLRDEGEAPRRGRRLAAARGERRPLADQGLRLGHADGAGRPAGLAGGTRARGRVAARFDEPPCRGAGSGGGTPGRGECGERRTGDTLGRSVPGRDCGGARGDTRGAASGRGRTRAAPGCGHAAAGREESAPASKPLPQRMRVPEAARPSSPQPAEAAPAERPIADAPRPGADAAPAQFRSEAFPAAPAANASAKSSAPRAAAPSAALADRSRRAQADGVLDARDEQGRTALVVAIQAGDAQSVRRLLEAGADPRLPDGQGITPLEHARRRGDVRIVELVEAAVERVP